MKPDPRQRKEPAKKPDPLVAELKRLGFVLDARAFDVLDSAIAHGNGRRTKGVLRVADMLATLRDAASSVDEHAFRIAEGTGTVTACLAMREGYERYIVGVAPCRADTPSPAGCAKWKLALWQPGADNADLLKSWAIDFDPGKVGVTRRAKPTRGVRPSDEASEIELLHQIAAARDDDAPRLVYADWLSATDPARAEFITTSCRAAALPPCAERTAFEKQANELRSAHHRRWESNFAWAKSLTYERGFVEIVEMDLKRVIANAARLFAPPGPAQLVTYVPDVAALTRLLEVPGIETLDGLHLIHPHGGGDALGLHLAAHRPAALARLRKLALIYARDAGARALADPDVLPSLERLDLVGEIGPVTLAVLRLRRGLVVHHTNEW